MIKRKKQEKKEGNEIEFQHERAVNDSVRRKLYAVERENHPPLIKLKKNQGNASKKPSRFEVIGKKREICISQADEESGFDHLSIVFQKDHRHSSRRLSASTGS